jgi:flagellar hook-associated protein 1 FlgK
MPDIYGILHIGKSALLTQQKAIDVTGHNIANVNTPGYSRQRVNMETREPIASQPGMMGTGVRAKEIQRIHDRLLGIQINNENQNLGRWESQKSSLERVEMIFDESTGYGLNQAMSEFWNAWHDVANDPSGEAARTVLVGKSERMAETFRQIDENLRQLQQDMDVTIKGTVEEINLISEEIADLNQKIMEAEATQQSTNDYRDKRDLLLTELSTLIDFNSFENSEGKVTVLTAGGRPLVENVSSWRLSTETNISGLQDVVWLDSEGNSVDITGSIAGGKLKGWLETRDVYIPDYLNKLDTLAGAIIAEVNALHAGGAGLDGSTGNAFFAGTSASDIAVEVSIASDVTLIAAAANAAGVPGDNANALAIADLQNALTLSGNTATFDEFYNALVSGVGNETHKAATYLDHQTATVSQLGNFRESIAGVSLDEEMVNLVKFQHAYDAAAKLITTVDELLGTLISMV